ncbi:MAG: AraC family transcriptional regulator [Pseudopedobacter saltans]|uniref:AraC family transcriptional regulator n=1 Tax=Pseudopedobacter saltans TaxID=151895 RepID=A0A2W5F1G9_9SPHI|nr:MAG: AraC family transcriptional regulator [Pseudopedobacter saltans]
MISFHKYLGKSATEENWGLYIASAGVSTVQKHQPYPVLNTHPNTHVFTWNRGRILNDYYLIYITKGGGVLETQYQKETIVSEGDCFFLYPGTWHRYRPNIETGWEEYWIGFNGYYPQKLMEAGFFNKKKAVINVGLSSDLLVNFQSIIETIQKANMGYHQIISACGLSILALVYNSIAYREENSNNPLQYISKAKFLLQEAYGRDVNMTKIAKQLTVSYSKFRKDFKMVTGVSPNQFLIEIRLNKAKELLKATNIPICEIAGQTGFDTLFYFSRLFKKKFNVAPTFYRGLK